MRPGLEKLNVYSLYFTDREKKLRDYPFTSSYVYVSNL